MKFLHYQFDAGPNDVIEVTLQGNAANVQLLDSINFSIYKNGQRYQYFGGHATKSPVRLVPPRQGVWHVVVDAGGYASSVRASARVLRNARV